MTFSDITEERQIRQLEGNISPPCAAARHFMKWGKSFVVHRICTQRIACFAVRAAQRDAIHWASSSHGAEVQNAQSWSGPFVSVMVRLRGSCKLKPRQSRNQRLYRTRGRYQPAYGRAALEQEKSRQHIEQLIQFDPRPVCQIAITCTITSMTWSTKRLSGGLSHQC